MKKSAFHRELVVASVVLTLSALLLASVSLSSARSRRTQKHSTAIDDGRSLRQAELQVHLASTRSTEFRGALAALVLLDEAGALEVWRTALSNSDPGLQREAWSKYRLVQAELTRKEFVPQVALVKAPPDEVLRFAKPAGLDVTIWSASNTQTVVAAPAYLVERLQSTGVDTQVLYGSVADWQRARGSGDVVAQSITPQYQSASADSASQIRIAVIDLADRGAISSGYSDWLGDREDILMRDGSRVAYLDIFSSDGSRASIDAHMAEQYTRRGYKLAGFYSPEEFADIAPRLFPGKNFDAGRRAKRGPAGDLRIALANGKFHSYDDTITEFKALAASHPGLARYS